MTVCGARVAEARTFKKFRDWFPVLAHFHVVKDGEIANGIVRVAGNQSRSARLTRQTAGDVS